MGNSVSRYFDSNKKYDDLPSSKLYIWGNDKTQDLFKLEEQSKHVDDKDLLTTIDNIACRYILTMDFNTMKQLHNREYCNKLIILTSDILNKYYNEIEIQQLRERTHQHDNILYANKKYLNETSNKESDCQQISKFYVKISHLFAAILMTIHPRYEYIDNQTGDTIVKTFKEKNDIPDNVEVTQYSNGLCHQKMNTLLGKLHSSGNNHEVHRENNLSEVTGIPELMNLYYDSEYDYATGEFHGMTTKTQRRFQIDLEDFYKVFTQSKNMPPNITKFSDIKIDNYYNIFSKEPIVELNEIKETHSSGYNQLIREYAKNLKNMMKNVNYHQRKLLEILNRIFLQQRNDTVRIQPSLNTQKLNQYIEETRNIIVDMYLNCEEHFLKGIQIYEAIVEKMILHTTQNQIDTLNIIIENIHYSPTSYPSLEKNIDIFSPFPKLNIS